MVALPPSRLCASIDIFNSEPNHVKITKSVCNIYMHYRVKYNGIFSHKYFLYC